MRTLTSLCVLVLAALLLWPCTAESAGKRQSRYSGQIADEQPPSTTAPKTARTLRWKLDGKSIDSYALEQESKAVVFSSDNPEGIGETTRMTGILQVRRQGDRTANLFVDDLGLQRLEGHGNSSKAPERMQPVMIQGMNEMGEVPPARTPARLLDFIFPVFVESLQLASTETREIMVPIPAEGTIIWANALDTITFDDWVLVGNRTCARLERTVRIDERNESWGQGRAYSIFFLVRSVSFFDPQTGRIVRSVTTMTTEVSVDTEEKGRGTLQPDGSYGSVKRTKGYRGDGFIRVVASE